MKFYFYALKTKFDTSQEKRIGLNQNGTPICFLRVVSELPPFLTWVNISGHWILKAEIRPRIQSGHETNYSLISHWTLSILDHSTNLWLFTSWTMNLSHVKEKFPLSHFHTVFTYRSVSSFSSSLSPWTQFLWFITQPSIISHFDFTNSLLSSQGVGKALTAHSRRQYPTLQTLFNASTHNLSLDLLRITFIIPFIHRRQIAHRLDSSAYTFTSKDFRAWLARSSLKLLCSLQESFLGVSLLKQAQT